MPLPNQMFRQFIEKHDAALPILPAVHITWATNICEIFDTNKLKLSECKFYKKELVYLFYGKPAYKLSRGRNPTTRLLGDAAVCFVLNATKLPSLHRAFALDTGAAFGNRYSEYLAGNISVDDFEIEAKCDSAARLVSTFFGGNKKYIGGEVRSDIEISGLDVVSDAYKAIASASVSSTLDERACTCELQYDAEVMLNNDTVQSVIMPDKMFGEKFVQEKMKEWGVKPIIYRLVRAEPGERTAVICEKLFEYYDRELM
jgi:hypothetical protein